MKKFISLIFLVVYFVVSTGFTVNLHYCMDEVYSWELGDGDDESDRCGMTTTKSDGCCRDEITIVKLQQDQVKATSALYSITLPPLVTFTTSFLLFPFKNIDVTGEFADHLPPLLSKQDTYLNNCVFRI